MGFGLLAVRLEGCVRAYIQHSASGDGGGQGLTFRRAHPGAIPAPELGVVHGQVSSTAAANGLTWEGSGRLETRDRFTTRMLWATRFCTTTAARNRQALGSHLMVIWTLRPYRS